jgi:carboxyl-terminal processing protease
MGKKYMLKSKPMSRLSRLVSFSLLILSLGVAFWAGFVAHNVVASPVELELLNEAYYLLETHYIDALPGDHILQRGMIRGMLETLNDPFTQFSEPEQHSIQSDTLAGEYGGIGAIITTDGDGKFYLAPFPNGPAAVAGISEGAQLLAIDGKPLDKEITIEMVTSLLRGPIGTTISLRIRQPAGGTRNVELVRVNIPLPSVTYYMLPGYENVGVVAINVFSERTPDEVQSAVSRLNEGGAETLILDLRNNGGGLLESAVEVSRLFLRGGNIVFEERRGVIEATYKVEKPGKFVEIPMVLVVDGTTASAAEVVAAAMQSNHRGLLLGDNTFGKGSVQVVVELSDGSSMRITSSRWLRPDGQAIDVNGLAPDVKLEPEEARSEQALFRAAQLLLEEMDQE